LGRFGRIGEQGLAGIPTAWLPFAGFALLMVLLALAERARPIHQSPREGPGRPIANFGLGVVNALLFSLLPLSTVAAADWARRADLGLFHWLALPAMAAIPLTVLLRSLAGYALHRLAHAVPMLWRMHSVHHCDTAVDLSTGLRHHPAELLYVAFALAGIAALLGLSAPALAGYELAAAGFGLWTHANWCMPSRLERALGWLLATPAVHHVHHSSAQVETDSNYGELLIVWDRLFGSYRRLDGARLRGLRPGLGGHHDAEAADLLVQLGAPFRPRAPKGAARSRR
jgi:sterol desaturase/sphingolipid hydroxylase (fatty acid hydroxylase superfamily)